MASYRPVMRDYKPTPAKPRLRGRWFLWFVAGLGLPMVTIAVMLPDSAINLFSSAAKTDDTPTAVSDVPLPLNPTSEISMYVAAPEPEPYGQRLELTVERGDSLDRLFRRHNLSSGDLAQIMHEGLAHKYLRLVKPGDKIIIWHQDNQIAELQREIDFSASLKVRRTSDGFAANLVEHNIAARNVEATGTIKSSLFMAAAEAGVSERTIMNLAGIFAWDVDFMLDIREGDRFHIIVEEHWRHGRRVAAGDILAAEFINRGKVFQAIRYRDPDGKVSYFSPEGRNMRKAFLRAPLSFSRVSSNFNPSRRHPVLNTIRAHKGVDYAAPRGTPVKAAGDGKVIFRGVKGGYGNTVILQHGGNITTLYAHMSNFNRKARNGSRVSQGQTIGYVGQSGLATGPHLHYEYRKNGVHRNPQTVNLPDAAPINPAFKDDFMRVAQPLISILDDKTIETYDLTTVRNAR